MLFAAVGAALLLQLAAIYTAPLRQPLGTELLPPHGERDRLQTLLRDDLIKAAQDLPEHTFPSVEQLVRRHRDPEDSFDLGAFDFVHMPGGHAPMVDFVDNPWIGEILHTLRENGTLISLICHGPVAMISAKYRVSPDGTVVTNTEHAFKGASLTTVAKSAEQYVLSDGYLKIPGETVSLGYFIDDALTDTGYDVQTAANPSPSRSSGRKTSDCSPATAPRHRRAHRTPAHPPPAPLILPSPGATEPAGRR